MLSKWDKKAILKEADRILKEGVLAGRIEQFMAHPFPDDPPEEWQNAFSDLFDELADSLPVYACCVFAFKMGQTWERFKNEVD